MKYERCNGSFSGLLRLFLPCNWQYRTPNVLSGLFFNFFQLADICGSICEPCFSFCFAPRCFILFLFRYHLIVEPDPFLGSYEKERASRCPFGPERRRKVNKGNPAQHTSMPPIITSHAGNRTAVEIAFPPSESVFLPPFKKATAY